MAPGFPDGPGGPYTTMMVVALDPGGRGDPGGACHQEDAAGGRGAPGPEEAEVRRRACRGDCGANSRGSEGPGGRQDRGGACLQEDAAGGRGAPGPEGAEVRRRACRG